MAAEILRCVQKGHCLSAASLSFLYTLLAKFPPLRYSWLRNREKPVQLSRDRVFFLRRDSTCRDLLPYSFVIKSRRKELTKGCVTDIITV